MKSSEKDLIRIEHMIQACEKIEGYLVNKSRDDLDKDEGLVLIISRLLEILGEASKHVSDEIRNSEYKIPWKEIAGSRDRLIHGYFDIDHDILWLTVSRDVPSLLVELRGIPSKLKE